MRVQTLLIVLVLGCSPSWLGCNSSHQQQAIIEEETPEPACDSTASANLRAAPQPAVAAGDQPKPLFFNDVLNIFTREEYRCARCHGDQYESPDEVRRKWVRVYAALKSGYMPRGAKRVTEADLALLRNWQAADFPADLADIQPKADANPKGDCQKPAS